MKIAVVGAGFSGSVVAHELAKDGHQISVFETRSHIGGNCFTKRDNDTGVLVHEYGPHIFHTDDEEVWNFVNQYTEFKDYINRVKSTVKGRVYSLPVNLHTINQFFEKSLSPKEAENFIKLLAKKSNAKAENFEEQALKFIGEDLYNAFFKGYTKKQWGIDPKEIPASVLKRLPIRFNYDDNYYFHKYQGMPINGYTPIFEKLLEPDNIKVMINKAFDQKDVYKYDHVFYSGPLDSWFNKRYGSLGYRTLDFHREVFDGDFQGCAVMNYGDENIPFTRITEHKHFAPWEKFNKTVIFKEYSRYCGENDIPYYPIRLTKDKDLLYKYIENAKKEEKVSFIGRLGTYRYLDMDVTIREALDAAKKTKKSIQNNIKIPPFFINV